MRTDLLAWLMITLAGLSACESQNTAEHLDGTLQVKQTQSELILSIMGDGWHSVGGGTAERTTPEGGILSFAYNEDGLAKIRLQIEESLIGAEEAYKHANDASLFKEVQRLRGALAQLQQSQYSNIRLFSPDAMCASFAVSFGGVNKCGCVGTQPTFSIQAQGSWSNCFKLSGYSQACIDGFCQSTTRPNKEVGTVSSEVSDSYSAGTVVTGNKSVKIWGTDPNDPTNKVEISINIPVSCTLPTCAAPPPPPPPPSINCDCYNPNPGCGECCGYAGRDGDTCYYCTMPGDQRGRCEYENEICTRLQPPCP